MEEHKVIADDGRALWAAESGRAGSGHADLDAVRVHFGPSKIALPGHSWGADVALHYALAHPERVSSLVYVAGTGLGQDWRAEYRRNLAERLGEPPVPEPTDRPLGSTGSPPGHTEEPQLGVELEVSMRAHSWR